MPRARALTYGWIGFIFGDTNSLTGVGGDGHREGARGARHREGRRDDPRHPAALAGAFFLVDMCGDAGVCGGLLCVVVDADPHHCLVDRSAETTTTTTTPP